MAWEISVRIDNEVILTIGKDFMSGEPKKIELKKDEIKQAVENLKSFIGSDNDPSDIRYW